MTAYSQQEILCSIEAAIKREVFIPSEPVSGDRWLLSSAMQKAIRRGEVERAKRAATSLWYQDRQNFWRRLHIVAIEDIGVASTDNVTKALFAMAAKSWRNKLGDLQVGLFIVSLLCKAVKTRIADELLLQAERSSGYKKIRESFANSSDDFLVGYLTDESNRLVERALALWYLAGTQKFPTELMPQRKGSPDKAVTVLRSLPVPKELVESCVSVMGKTQYALALLTPLTWQEVEKQRSQLQIRENIIPDSPDIEGLPYYCADLYTRTGQSCFRQLQRAVPELQYYGVRQIGIAVFYLEGGLLDKVISSKFLDEFSIAGEFADAEGVGLSVPDYLHLKDCVSKNMQLLKTIRSEQLQRYFNGTDLDKVSTIQGKPTITHYSVKEGI